MRRVTSWLIVLAVTSCAMVEPQAQAPAKASITNADVVALHQAGFSSEIVVNAIGQAPTTQFDLSPSALLELKTAGIGDAVILAMQNAGRPTSSTAVDGTRAPSLADARSAFVVNAAVGPNWIGTGDRFRELTAELTSWRRFELVNEPNRADVVITLGTASSGQSGAAIIGNMVFASSSFVYTLSIQQQATGIVLWTSSEQVGSFDQKATLKKILKRLREQVPAPPNPASSDPSRSASSSPSPGSMPAVASAGGLPKLAKVYSAPNGSLLLFEQTGELAQATWRSANGVAFARARLQWSPTEGAFTGSGSIQYACGSRMVDVPLLTIQIFAVSDATIRERYSNPERVDCRSGMIKSYSSQELLWSAAQLKQ